MKKLSIFFVAAIVGISCGSSTTETTVQKKTVINADFNNAFDSFSDSFVNQLWQYEPEWATYLGNHRNDSVLSIPTAENKEQYREFVQEQLNRLKSFHPDSMTASQRIDYYLIQNQLERTIWSITELKSEQWDPSIYNPTGLIAFMLNENYSTLEIRLENINKRLQKFTLFFQAADANLSNPVPELKALAIQQLKGGLHILENDLVDSIQSSKLTPAEKSTYLNNNKTAIAATKEFIQTLSQKKYAKQRSFRLGQELYEQKFRFDIQSSLTARQLYENAKERKQYLHGEMAKLSQLLWPKYFNQQELPADTLKLISQVIDTLSAFHVAPEDFQSAIEAQLPELTAFINEKNLLYLDESKPLVVRKEPAYMAGIAGASINSPGPYDQGGNTYYNVGSLEGWDKERAESYLREYNNYTLQILNIHEAIPGHYTQLVYANRSPSPIKSIFANGAMIEGWAVYAEQMMLESGYGDNAPEMWLMWYKWHLRTVCNTILDYEVHVNNWSKSQAMHLLVEEAFQQKAEAEGKWNRVNVSSVQLLSYYSGYREIYDLRERLKQQDGPSFNLRSFHEKFLSYGNAPVKYISELMLEKRHK